MDLENLDYAALLAIEGDRLKLYRELRQEFGNRK